LQFQLSPTPSTSTIPTTALTTTTATTSYFYCHFQEKKKDAMLRRAQSVSIGAQSVSIGIPPIPFEDPLVVREFESTHPEMNRPQNGSTVLL
jgi:hypothetical protein